MSDKVENKAMPNSQRRGSLSLASQSSSTLEINTNTFIKEHNGDTYVGSQVANCSQDLKMKEEIQINIQSDSPVVIETLDKTPQIIINHLGPSIHLTSDIVAMLRNEGEWHNFLENVYKLSLKQKKIEATKEDHGLQQNFGKLTMLGP